MKIAHIGDTHLGYRGRGPLAADGRSQRTVDFEKAWLSACSDIVAARPDVVIHAGDIFHRARPGWDAVRAFVLGCGMFQRAEIPFLAIVGNHDVSRFSEAVSMFDYLNEAIPTIRIASGTRVERYTFPWCEVCLVPHHAIGLETNEYPIGPESILVLHGEFGNDGRYGEVELGSAQLDPDVLERPWGYVAVGHYHRQSEIGPMAWYCGSLERCGFSDEDSVCGWLLVDTDARTVTNQPVQARPMRTFGPFAFTTVRGIVDEIEANIIGEVTIPTYVRCIVTGASPGALRQIEASVRSGMGRDMWHIEVVRPLSYEQDPEAMQEAESGPLERLDLHSLFDEFCAGPVGSHPLGPVLKERGRAALVRASEVMAASAAAEAM